MTMSDNTQDTDLNKHAVTRRSMLSGLHHMMPYTA